MLILIISQMCSQICDCNFGDHLEQQFFFEYLYEHIWNHEFVGTQK